MATMLDESIQVLIIIIIIIIIIFIFIFIFISIISVQFMRLCFFSRGRVQTLDLGHLGLGVFSLDG